MLQESRPIRQSMMRKNRKKIVVSSIATIFLVLLYVLIFTFSEQDGETSGGLSQMISERCVEIFNALAGKNWSELMMHSMAEYFENPIRKLAHFCEYAVMGVLLFLIWYPWLGLYGRVAGQKGSCGLLQGLPRLVKLIVPWIFVSAAFDEIHQLFIPGRNGNFLDVLLDTAGGCFGLLCCIVIVKLIERRKDKRGSVAK